MKKQITTHESEIEFLKKIEGQIKGVQRMIEERRYCVDIITQIRSIVGALHRVEDGILKRHIEGCIVGSFKGKSEGEKSKKIAELVDLVSKFKRA